MPVRPSLITRIAVGKSVGFIIGLAFFFLLPFLLPGDNWSLRWGTLLWYTTVGAVIGVFGVFTWHPVLHLPMPWWFRSPLIGAWMNFVLTFFAYNEFARILDAMFGPDSFMSSPFWFVLEGALVGLIIGFFATRVGGEGKDTVEQRAPA